MANYLHQANFLLNDAFPASVRIYSSSSLSESAAETAWHNGFKACWNQASFTALMPATSHFISTSTSTMSAAWKQTTKTVTDEDIPGTGGDALPYETGVLVTWETALATKSGHGRWYLPSPVVTALAADGWYYSAATRTAVAAGINALWAAITPNITPLLLHRRSLTTDPIVHSNTPDNIVIQRRRADKRVPARTSIF